MPHVSQAKLFDFDDGSRGKLIGKVFDIGACVRFGTAGDSQAQNELWGDLTVSKVFGTQLGVEYLGIAFDDFRVVDIDIAIDIFRGERMF